MTLIKLNICSNLYHAKLHVIVRSMKIQEARNGWKPAAEDEVILVLLHQPQYQSIGESCESVGAHSVQWLSNTSNPSRPIQGAKYVYSLHRKCVCVCMRACAWILRHISVKWVCAHNVNHFSYGKIKKKNKFQILFILHTVIKNYKTFSLPLECKNQTENWVVDDQEHHTDFVSKILPRLWLMCQRTAGLYLCFSCDKAIRNYLWNLGLLLLHKIHLLPSHKDA